MKTKTINQTVIITGSTPHDIYEMLMDSKKHASLVNSTASIDRKNGGKFEIYDGYIEGSNIELEKDARIVQNWRGEEDCWPKGHYSRLTIELVKEKNDTRINLVQEGVPEDCYEDFNSGWYEFYWNPLQKIFDNK